MLNHFVDIEHIIMPDNISKINFYQNDGTYEIACSLFETCNLNCRFCFETHKEKIDIKRILDLPKKIIDAVNSDIVFYHSNKIIIRVWGGELFYDAIPDKMIDVYYIFATTLKNMLQKKFPNTSILFSWGSNGVFKKRDRVLHLLKNTHSSICFSYDPCDRFDTLEEEQLCLDSINFFHEHRVLNGISMTETKRNINACIHEKAKTFKDLARKYKIDLNAYIANSGYEAFLPTTKKLSDFYVWCAKNKLYNISVLQDIINNKNKLNNGCTDIERRCRCKLRTVFSPDGRWTHNCVKECSDLPLEQFYGMHKPNEDNVSEVKSTLGISKSGCLYCRYYSYCPSLCWTAVLFCKEKDVCPYKKMIEILEDNGVC